MRAAGGAAGVPWFGLPQVDFLVISQLVTLSMIILGVISFLVWVLWVQRKSNKPGAKKTYPIEITPSNPDTWAIEAALEALEISGTLQPDLPLSDCVGHDYTAGIAYELLPTFQWRGNREDDEDNMDRLVQHIEQWLKDVPGITVLCVASIDIIHYSTELVAVNGRTDVLVVDTVLSAHLLGTSWQQVANRQSVMTEHLGNQLLDATLILYAAKPTHWIPRGKNARKMKKQAVAQCIAVSGARPDDDFVVFCGDGNPRTTFAARIAVSAGEGRQLQVIKGEQEGGTDMQRYMVAAVRSRQQVIAKTPAHSILYQQPPPPADAQLTRPVTRAQLRQRQLQQQHQQAAMLRAAVGVGASVQYANHVELAADPQLDDYHERVATNQAISARISRDFQKLGLVPEGCGVSADVVGWGWEIAKAVADAMQSGKIPAPAAVAACDESASVDDAAEEGATSSSLKLQAPDVADDAAGTSDQGCA